MRKKVKKKGREKREPHNQDSTIADVGIENLRKIFVLIGMALTPIKVNAPVHRSCCLPISVFVTIVNCIYVHSFKVVCITPRH